MQDLIRKKYTEGVYKLTVTYLDHRLEFNTSESDGKDLKEYIDSLHNELAQYRKVWK